MQKDVHFYLTYLLSIKAGIKHAKAEIIAWANQYTDELTVAELHGIQTQSSSLGNWEDKQIQFSVLVPFHFIPGNDPKHKWVTTRNNAHARRLVKQASKNHFRLGIALHGLQDTFSHEGFSGWQEDINSCFPWYYIESGLPNVGHAEMRAIPDVVNYVWTDPRSGKKIDNKRRTLSAAKATYDFLTKFFNPAVKPEVWQELRKHLVQAFRIDSYDDRKQRFRDLSCNSGIKYKTVCKKFKEIHKEDFILAAKGHLASVMDMFKNLYNG